MEAGRFGGERKNKKLLVKEGGRTPRRLPLVGVEALCSTGPMKNRLDRGGLLMEAR
jgi:hypothetical protein